MTWQKLAVNDPIRYTQWDAAQKRMAAVHREVAAVQEQQAAEQAQRLQHYRMREAELFAERRRSLPILWQSKKLMDGAVTYLRDLGFQDQELGELWNGARNISIHDHRLHLLLRDGIKWRDASAKARTVTGQASSTRSAARRRAGPRAHCAKPNCKTQQATRQFRAGATMRSRQPQHCLRPAGAPLDNAAQAADAAQAARKEYNGSSYQYVLQLFRDRQPRRPV